MSIVSPTVYVQCMHAVNYANHNDYHHGLRLLVQYDYVILALYLYCGKINNYVIQSAYTITTLHHNHHYHHHHCYHHHYHPHIRYAVVCISTVTLSLVSTNTCIVYFARLYLHSSCICMYRHRQILCMCILHLYTTTAWWHKATPPCCSEG